MSNNQNTIKQQICPKKVSDENHIQMNTNSLKQKRICQKKLSDDSTNGKINLKEQIISRNVSEQSFEDKTVRKLYWKKQIKKMEHSVITPHARRKQYVKKMIPSDVFHAVYNVLDFENDDIADTEQKSLEKLVKDENYSESDNISNMRGKTLLDTEIKQEHTAEQSESRRESKEFELPEEETLSDSEHRSKVNPYINFLNKSPEIANIWLPKKPPDFRVKPLIEKSEIITHNIINDFIEWLNTLGQINSDISLNENTLEEMFRIGVNEFAIKSLCIDVKEMGSVPTAVANATHNPESSTRRVLQSNLIRDMRAEKLKKHTHAFGRALPAELQIFPPKNDTYNRWIKCLHVPNELKTLEYVFKDITDISSVRAYCQWLLTHPNTLRPQYLVNEGLLNPEYWKETMSIDTRELEEFISSTLKKEFPPKEQTRSHKTIAFEDVISMSM